MISSKGVAVVGTLALLWAYFSTSPMAALADETVDVIPSSCVHTYYDRNMYGWLAIENTCNEAIHVVTCPHLPDNADYCGGMELAAGAHDSTGSSRDDVERKGGFYWTYPCPIGSTARRTDGSQLMSSLTSLRYECLKSF